MSRLLVIVLAFFSLSEASAQGSDSVVVNKDPRVDLLVNKQIEINEVTTRHSRSAAPGDRVLVVSSNDRKKVVEAKTKMYREFPELKAYMMYQAPFFRLKVGNFRDRVEAEEYLANIQRFFPTGAYIVTDTIEIRPD